LAQIADLALFGHDALPPEAQQGLEVTARFKAPPFTFSNACHACTVEVDPRTGEVRILRYAVSEDCGVMINPMVVEGQIAGGVVQGVGGTLYEHFIYDDDGNPPFCERGPRFGTHAANENFYAPYYGKLLIVSYFNAGLQVFDIRDPFNPRRVAYFIQAPNRNAHNSRHLRAVVGGYIVVSSAENSFAFQPKLGYSRFRSVGAHFIHDSDIAV